MTGVKRFKRKRKRCNLVRKLPGHHGQNWNDYSKLRRYIPTYFPGSPHDIRPQDCQVLRKHLQTLEEALKDRGEQDALVQSIREEMEKQHIAHKEETSALVVRPFFDIHSPVIMLRTLQGWEERGEGAKDRLASLEKRIAHERQELATRTTEANAEYQTATKEREHADTRIDSESRVALDLEREVGRCVFEGWRVLLTMYRLL